MITVNAKNFIQAVGKISAAANKRAINLPVMLHKREGILEIYTESGDVYASTLIDADGLDELKVFCELSELSKLVKKFKTGGQVVNLFQSEKTVSFIYNDFEFQLNLLNRNEPLIPQIEFETIGDFSAREAFILFDLMPPLVPSDRSKPSIECVYLDIVDGTAAITAANGYQLSRVEYPCEFNNARVMISQVSLQLLFKFFVKTGFTFFISADCKYIKYVNGTDWVTCRNHVDIYKYPEIAKVIKNAVGNSTTVVDFYTEDVLKLLKESSLLKKDPIAAFAVEDSIAGLKFLDMDTQNLLRDSVQLAADVDGPPVKVYLNTNYVINALKGCEFDCKMQVGKSSAVFNSEYSVNGELGTYLGVVMGIAVRD